jgi:retron-type reverse transcriptase
MQKTKVNFDTVYEFETLYNAYRASRRGKRWKNTVAKVEMNALEAIAVLQEELSTGTYRPGGYREFYVFEPKKRLIQTNSFKDKIVQHAFCDTILYDVLTRPFILDNYGSQIGKGTHFGLNRLRDFMREYYRRHGSADGWVLKADVHHYFASIRHDILKQDVRELLDDERSLALTDKTQIFPLRNGLDFLGFHSYLTDTGKVVRKLRRASRERMKRKLRKYKVMYESGAITKEKITESYQSWRSHASHGDCHALIQKYDQLYNEIFERSETADVPIN